MYPLRNDYSSRLSFGSFPIHHYESYQLDQMQYKDNECDEEEHQKEENGNHSLHLYIDHLMLSLSLSKINA